MNSGGSITGGTFYGTITVAAGGSISGGTFHGAVTSFGTITGGQYNIANGVLATGQGVSGVTYFVENANSNGVITDITGGAFANVATLRLSLPPARGVLPPTAKAQAPISRSPLPTCDMGLLSGCHRLRAHATSRTLMARQRSMVRQWT